MSSLRIVLGNGSLAEYQQGGGHWAVRIQYLYGLRDLNHEVTLLELLWSTGDPKSDDRAICSFFKRLEAYGLRDCCALLLFGRDAEQSLENARAYGKSMEEIKEVIKSADLLWNDCCGVRQPLLGMFRRRMLVDLDPGHLQVSALTVDMDIHSHDAFLTIGRKMHDSDCQVPTLGLRWQTFTPFVYLPMWEAAPDPGPEMPFTSVTHWRWGELWWGDRILSISKRDAYLRYLDLPERAQRPFELAALIVPDDQTGDRELLQNHGWKLVDPWKVAGSVEDYKKHIAISRAEISCPKPIFTELKTGWFSDRSACYLASGRPVLAEDTGFSAYFPIGKGLLAFRDIAEAVAGVAEIDANYELHRRAARDIAEEFLDSRRCLPAILSACG